MSGFPTRIREADRCSVITPRRGFKFDDRPVPRPGRRLPSSQCPSIMILSEMGPEGTAAILARAG